MRALTLAVVVSLMSFVCLADTAPANPAEVGSQLAFLVEERNHFKPKTLANYKALKDALDAAKCDGLKYRFYVVGDTLYVVGSSRQGVTIGRHFKFNLKEDLIDVSSMQASTNSCLVLRSEPSAVALFVTHVLSDTPTEFHVMASVVSGKAIYVGTKNAVWKVSGPSIEFVQEMEPEADK